MFDSNPGGQTLTIRRRPETVTKDANGITTSDPDDDQLIPKTGCLAEIQSAAESQARVTINRETAWFFFPVDDDTRAITPQDAIDFDGRTFELRAPRVIEYGVDGEAVQVWCVGEWTKV
ncbi:hypothetical protein [Mycolicibacterium fortuitum]|nr:hypothetical protein [Mycolicibacterium fortuitum]